MTKKAEALTNLQRRSMEEDEDPFVRFYGTFSLIQPPYPFSDLWRIFEECDTLQACLKSRMDNIERPHDFEFSGDDKKEKTSDINVASRIKMRDLLSRVNEKEAFLDLRKKARLESDVTKSPFIEVIRNYVREPERFYYTPSTNMRITRLDDEATPAVFSIPREGKILKVTWSKRFRRFAYMYLGQKSMVWFKEFGDPRIVDYRNGEYIRKADGTFLREPADYPYKATEIWWWGERWAGNAYGIPEWISVLFDIRGRYTAKWINYDHLDQGAISPFAIAPQGGKLTPNSRKELDQILSEMKDPSYYNRIPILEMEADTVVDLNRGASKSQTSLNVIKLREPNNEDYMFGAYLKETEDAIRKCFRLPPIFVGASSDYTNATSYASIEVAETQVFEPERRSFDHKITTELIQNEFGIYQWSLKTRSSTLGDKETLYRALGTIVRNGGGSSNQVVELANGLLGTDWSTQEGEAYNEPWAMVQLLAGQGLIGVQDGKIVLRDAPLQQSAPQSLGDLIPPGDTQPSPDAKPDQTQETPQPDVTTTKDEAPDEPENASPDTDAVELYAILTRLEARGYAPSEVTEQTYAL